MENTVIAVAQLAIAIGEPEANRKAAAAAVAEAAAAGARLVVLPELCDSGYVFGDDPDRASAEAGALASPADDSDTLRQWHALAAEHQLVSVGGFCERGADGRLFNSAALVDASGTRVVYRKAHLWDQEKLVFTPGDAAPPVVDLAFGRVALMICYDLEFPEWVRLPALDGADLIAAPVNWPSVSWPAGESVSACAIVCGRVPCSCRYAPDRSCHCCITSSRARSASVSAAMSAGSPVGKVTSALTCTPMIRSGAARPMSGAMNAPTSPPCTP